MVEKEILHDVFLGLGSNLGDKGENLVHAINKIEERMGAVVATSAFYVTKPVGFVSENQFLNAVCKLKTSLQPLPILAMTQDIEKEMGRMLKSKNEQYADRTIDIDILLYGEEVIQTPCLTIPHLRLHERLFVLVPLAEIAGESIHPIFHKTISELKEALN